MADDDNRKKQELDRGYKVRPEVRIDEALSPVGPGAGLFVALGISTRRRSWRARRGNQRALNLSLHCLLFVTLFVILGLPR
ncbi:hypothetical protein SCP_0900940 [Sparassis crispa]|uniref:Uncharacterized protein n=1 Tax=Sparassis crispa TaxID=139825 RepID=A0A401GVH3_9APHY|nr:hypothetical protein SCP_0900940 [Sparassis crispa]GBE86215.1 hypothetical protein SCP_0900940 [Sparassis crispa]